MKYIKVEGVNQKHIARKAKISESDLSRFKNKKSELGYIDSKSLDKFLTNKNY
ncbi:hypothetical protein AALC75_20980 [Lachnospiraceae bacterium 48-42]